MVSAAIDNTFGNRLARHHDELDQLFMSLYDDRAALEDLEQAMAAAYEARPDDLKKLDKQREADPDWYKRGTMFGMTMYTDLFAGSLRKLANRIPYLEEQHLTYLHLMPLLKMPHPQNDGGYAVEDFNTVDPSLGTNADLASLTKKLRKAGISLCLDFVMNHTASTHEWAMKAKAGDPEYQDYYFCYDDRTIPDEYERTTPQVFPNTAPGNFSWCDEMHKWVLTSFYPFQWDLNYRNPKVLVAMLTSALNLANLGVEVLRIDAVPYIWKQLGTTSRNLPQVHTIVRMLRIALESTCCTTSPRWSTCGARSPTATPVCSRRRSTRWTHCPRTAGSSTTCAAMTTSAGVWTSRRSGGSASTRSATRSSCITSTRVRSPAAGRWASCTTTTRPAATPAAAASGDARSCGTTASLCGIEKALYTHDKPSLERGIDRDLLMHKAMAFLRGFPMLNCGDEIAQLRTAATCTAASSTGAPPRSATSRGRCRTACGRAWPNCARCATTRASRRTRG